MQNTKTNEDRAQDVLTELHVTHKALGEIRKEVSMIEFGLIKDFVEKNPNIDTDVKIKVDVREEEKASIATYLDNTVPTPLGYKNPSAGINATQMQERVRASMAHILAGKPVSDDKLTQMRDALKDMQSVHAQMVDRRDKYNAEDYDKTMVNPVVMQENADKGTNVFKGTQQLILSATVNQKDNAMQPFAVERNTGNDGRFPSYSFPTNETAFSPVYGNPFTAKAILVVSGDLQNKRVNEGRQGNADKSAAVTDTAEAALLAHMINIKGHDTTNQDYAVVTVDTRAFDGFMHKIDQVNPDAAIKVYSDTQTAAIESISRHGVKYKIDSPLKQTFDWAKRHATSPENALDKALIIKNSEDSLSEIIENVRKGAEATHPNDDYQQRGLIQETYKQLKSSMDDFGANVVDKFLKAYQGNKHEMDNDLITKREMSAEEQLEQRALDASRNSRASKMEVTHNKEVDRQNAAAVDNRQASLIDDNQAPAPTAPRPAMR